MKKTLIAATLMVYAGSAFAEPTAVLQVQGKLTNASCTPELSNGGVVDYGYIRLAALNATGNNQLGEKSIDLTINCNTATKVYWTMTDNQHDTIAHITVADRNNANLEYYQFGVGMTDNNVKIGNYSVLVNENSALVDGVTVDTILKNIDQNTWTYAGAQRSDTYTMLTVAKTGQLEPLAFTTAVFPLKTTLAIQGTDTLAITDDTNINGQATITLGYL